MKIAGVHHRSIGLWDDGWAVRVLDQRRLPWQVAWVRLETLAHAAAAIADMWVRGAPLIGATAAYGVALAMREDASDDGLAAAHAMLAATRPTAINLRWALDRMARVLASLPAAQRREAAYTEAAAIADEDARLCEAIGVHGLALIGAARARAPHRPVHVLTHCNAGWLATVDWGTALAPVYKAHDAGIPVQVWVDETRPRNQGALLTAFELAEHGVPHTVIADNAGGLLMQRGDVDLVIVGTDRVTANGDVCNKIGTYLKALAAHDTGVPFHVALPYSTFDPATPDGASVPIEERAGEEVGWIEGPDHAGALHRVRVTGSGVANPAFDITPARLVTGYITERGVGGIETLANRPG